VTPNGRASVLVRRDNSIHALVAVTTSDHGINQVLWIRNPDKLATIAETRAARPLTIPVATGGLL
jgi:RNA polymerase sigma-70 factor (ECF subfamily)